MTPIRRFGGGRRLDRVGAGVAGVVVLVAGQHEPHPVPLGGTEHAVDEPQQRVERAVGLRGVQLAARRLQPARARRAQDDLRVAEQGAGGAGGRFSGVALSGSSSMSESTRALTIFLSAEAGRTGGEE